jgi:hypothetical protein
VKGLLLLVLISLAAAGVFFGYPLVDEDSGSECDAFERLAVRLAIGTDRQKPPPSDLLLGQFLQGFSKGQLARAEARDRYPNAPAAVACAMLYWRAVSDPNGFRLAPLGRR